MKITKSRLLQIIKEELNEALPPHLQSKVDAYEKKKRQYSITDVTPAGYGPDWEEPSEEEDPPKQEPKKSRAPRRKEIKEDNLEE